MRQDGLRIRRLDKGLRSDGGRMPSELTTKEQFKELLKDAVEVRVVRSDETAKVKLRTKKGLHTFKTTPDEADALLKGVKIPVVEF